MFDVQDFIRVDEVRSFLDFVKDKYIDDDFAAEVVYEQIWLTEFRRWNRWLTVENEFNVVQAQRLVDYWINSESNHELLPTLQVSSAIVAGAVSPLLLLRRQFRSLTNEIDPADVGLSPQQWQELQGLVFYSECLPELTYSNLGEEISDALSDGSLTAAQVLKEEIPTFILQATRSRMLFDLSALANHETDIPITMAHLDFLKVIKRLTPAKLPIDVHHLMQVAKTIGGFLPSPIGTLVIARPF